MCMQRPAPLAQCKTIDMLLPQQSYIIDGLWSHIATVRAAYTYTLSWWSILTHCHDDDAKFVFFFVLRQVFRTNSLAEGFVDFIIYFFSKSAKLDDITCDTCSFLSYSVIWSSLAHCSASNACLELWKNKQMHNVWVTTAFTCSMSYHWHLASSTGGHWSHIATLFAVILTHCKSDNVKSRADLIFKTTSIYFDRLTHFDTIMAHDLQLLHRLTNEITVL